MGDSGARCPDLLSARRAHTWEVALCPVGRHGSCVPTRNQEESQNPEGTRAWLDLWDVPAWNLSQAGSGRAGPWGRP